MIKHESTTKAIRNAGKVLNMNIIVTNNISDNLKINRFKIPEPKSALRIAKPLAEKSEEINSYIISIVPSVSIGANEYKPQNKFAKR